MIDKIEDLQETLLMIKMLIDQIDHFYSINSTLIRDVKPGSTKFVLEKAAGLLTASLIKEGNSGNDRKTI